MNKFSRWTMLVGVVGSMMTVAASSTGQAHEQCEGSMTTSASCAQYHAPTPVPMTSDPTPTLTLHEPPRELANTGFLVIPIAGAGLVLLTVGLIMRGRERDQRS